MIYFVCGGCHRCYRPQEPRRCRCTAPLIEEYLPEVEDILDGMVARVAIEDTLEVPEEMQLL